MFVITQGFGGATLVSQGYIGGSITYASFDHARLPAQFDVDALAGQFDFATLSPQFDYEVL